MMFDGSLGKEVEAEVDVEADVVDSMVMAAFIFSIFGAGGFWASRRVLLGFTTVPNI